MVHDRVAFVFNSVVIRVHSDNYLRIRERLFCLFNRTSVSKVKQVEHSIDVDFYLCLLNTSFSLFQNHRLILLAIFGVQI